MCVCVCVVCGVCVCMYIYIYIYIHTHIIIIINIIILISIQALIGTFMRKVAMFVSWTNSFESQQFTKLLWMINLQTGPIHLSRVRLINDYWLRDMKDLNFQLKKTLLYGCRRLGIQSMHLMYVLWYIYGLFLQTETFSAHSLRCGTY